MAEIKETDLSVYLGGKFKTNNFNFNSNKDMDFQPLKEKYRLSADQKKCEAFEKLCEVYNEKIKEYRDNETIHNDTLEIYKTLKDMESSDSENAEVFLNSQIQKEINSFRKLKVQFNAKLEKAKKVLDNNKKIRKFNIKERVKAERALSSAKKALDNFKYARKSIKNKARSQNIITSSTFIHSVINYKNKDIPETYTGILGSLVAVGFFIKKYRDDDRWKKLKLKEIIEMQTRLEYGSKGYENSLKLFNDGAKLAEKFKDNNDDITSDKVNMNSAIQELKRKVNKFFNKQLEILTSKKSNSSIKSYAKKTQKGFETRRSDWINEYKEIFNDEENLGTFIDIYFQTKSLAILNGKSNKFSKLLTSYNISVGIVYIILGGIYCTVCVPAGIVIIVIGIGIIIGFSVGELHTSGFKKNERAFSEAVSKTPKKEKQ